MMIGDQNHPNPTVQIPPWDPFDNPTVHISSPFFHSNAGGDASGDYSPSVEALTAALHRFLPSNESDSLSEDLDVPVDAFSCDQFRMYEFKVRKCARGRSHDWTECPYAHPGEKARRRDPRRYHYSGTACPEFRKGSCKKGDSCEFAHGVFECWLHPARYRTQPCKDGPGCIRRICFFAHTPEQLRLSESEYGFPSRHAFDSYLPTGMYVDSPTSILASSMMSPISPSSESPPMSPNGFQLGGGSFNSVNELATVMGNLRLGKMKMSPRSRGVQLGSGFGSPRILSHGFNSLPSTPTRGRTRSGLGSLDLWQQTCEEEEHVMERVESGRNLREKMFAKLSEENLLGQFDSVASCPDVGWISELVK